MSRFYSYINSAAVFLKKYNGREPFATFSKTQFAAEKKFGSGDRKVITDLCFGFFRVSDLFKEDPPEEAIVKAWFLLKQNDNGFLKTVQPDLLPFITYSFNEKLKVLGKNEFLFRLSEHVSSEIDFKAYSLALLKQPSTFLRIRPGKKEKVIRALTEKSIEFSLIEEEAIELLPGTNLEHTFQLHRDAVIQDISSQHVLDSLPDFRDQLSQGRPQVWDCCAASGGKSILIYDKFQSKVTLTVSDIRPQIISTLKERLSFAGVPVADSFISDLSIAEHHGEFDIIVCDAPCTGSGTWARTPEQLYFFREEKINEYAVLQKKIIQNSVAALKNGGYYCYITCSVFWEENENAVDYLKSMGLEFLNATYHKGYHKNADTLFSALFRKSAL